jgi:hypothetical protein
MPFPGAAGLRCVVAAFEKLRPRLRVESPPQGAEQFGGIGAGDSRGNLDVPASVVVIGDC